MVIYVYSSCQPLNHQLSECNKYIDGDVYYDTNQSDRLVAALNATDIVIGSYCRDRAMEFLCNYFFPPCVNNNTNNIINPICSNSCSEYLVTGICVGHMNALLLELNDTEKYPNVSVNKLWQRDCSPPYNLFISENCVNLTGN